MPRHGAYVCSLTKRHVAKIEQLLGIMTTMEILDERKTLAATIRYILRSPQARKSIKA